MATIETHFDTQTDAELLNAFNRKRDQDAFRTLVERHHSMVFGVAKKMLGCTHAAEDVLQATFLVLAKDAHKIRKRSSLASWLYGVTYRISARFAKQRARTPISTLENEVMVTSDPLQLLTEQFEHNLVFDELHRLPETLRTPMILRYVQGKTNAEVATNMALSESAVEGRLKRGRTQLRMRLARQGVAFGTLALVLDSMSSESAASEASDLLQSTVENCLDQSSETANLIRPEVIQLAEEEILKMATIKLTNTLLVLFAAAAVTVAGWSLSGDGTVHGQEAGNPFGNVVVRNTTKAKGTNAEQTVRVAAPENVSSASDPFGNPFGIASRQTAQSNNPTSRLKQLGYFSVDQRSESEVRILETLERDATLQFEDEPLRNVIEVIKADFSIPIVFDERALEDENIDPASDAVTFDLSNIKLRNALTLMLDTLNLDYVIRNEVCVITTQEAAEETLITRVYRLPQHWQLSEDEAIDAVTTAVSPETWSDVGGPSSVLSVQGGIVVTTTRRVHEKINQLFGQFDRLYAATSGNEFTVRGLKQNPSRGNSQQKPSRNQGQQQQPASPY